MLLASDQLVEGAEPVSVIALASGNIPRVP